MPKIAKKAKYRKLLRKCIAFLRVTPSNHKQKFLTVVNFVMATKCVLDLKS